MCREDEKLASILEKMKLREEIRVFLLQLYEWCREFELWVSDLVDATRYGRITPANNSDTKTKVRHIVWNNWRLTTNEVAGKIKTDNS